MPKGVGYGEASKMMSRRSKKKKAEKALKKKNGVDTPRTTAIERRLKQAGMSDEEIRSLRGKNKKKGK